jgi:dipeptidyl aminopeptidase/acylaminoacyl peptidase
MACRCAAKQPMNLLARLAFVSLVALAACSSPPKDDEDGEGRQSDSSVVEPNLNLVSIEVPPIPKDLAKAVAKYTDFRGHGFVDWHPLRREMLVSHRKAGGETMQLFRVASPMGKAEQLTDLPDPVTRALYEPREGRYIVFERSNGGDEASQIYRLDPGSREPTAITSEGERHTIELFLNRRSRLIYSSVPLNRTGQGGNRESPTQILTLIDPANPMDRRRLAELRGTGWSVDAVSWDDRYVALTRHLSANESQVWLLELDQGRLRQLLPAPGTKGSRAVYIAGGFRRDNSGLFVVTDREGEFRQLMFHRFEDQRLVPMTRHIRWDVDGVTLSDDGRLLAARVNVDGRHELRLFDAHRFREVAVPRLPGGTVNHVQFRPNTLELAVSMSSAKAPSELHSVDMEGSTRKPTQWTRAYAASGVNTAAFPEQKIVRWRSYDGLTISGLLTAPPAKFTGPRPVLVLVHGGPESQATMGFLNRYNYLVNEMGIAIVEPNIRGSSGYGKTFLALDNGPKREDSIRDIGALLGWIATQPRFDASRVIIAGSSYGGYVALSSAIHYADRIAGAIDMVGISNFVTFLENTESYRRDLRRAEYGDERDPVMREFLLGISPLTHAKRITRPLFVVQGLNDPRVPYTEAEQLVGTVRQNGNPVWYLRADNEGHGFVRKENADYQFYAMVMFLQAALMR